MALILTYLGKGGTGRTTVAVAAAKKLAAQGKRVLLASAEAGPALGLLLGQTLGIDPLVLEPSLSVVQLQATALVQRGWEVLKQKEAQYLRSPFFKNVYGEELGILPGMDSALTLNAVRDYAQSGLYDVIVYDGDSSLETLRTFGSLEVTSWYVRRFKQVILESDIGKSLMPFIQPISATVLQNAWSGGDMNGPMQEAENLLEEGRQAINDPARMMTFLVTTGDELAIATARHFWGSAQQVGLTVGGVLVTQGANPATLASQFTPLPLHALPSYTGDWQPLMDALPSPSEGLGAPEPLEIDVQAGQVRVFLPGFDKKQVKLTQYNQEVTIDAGDQRRNILLPPELRGRSVTGAKFQDSYLVISF